jgi:hypothetical protein
MTDRHRPPKDVRIATSLGRDLANAVLSGQQATARTLAEKLLAANVRTPR